MIDEYANSIAHDNTETKSNFLTFNQRQTPNQRCTRKPTKSLTWDCWSVTPASVVPDSQIKGHTSSFQVTLLYFKNAHKQSVQALAREII